MSDDLLRVGDRDREGYIEQLRGHTVEGRLTLDEFGDRVGEVYAARTRADLERTLRQLPRVIEAPSGRRSRRTSSRPPRTRLARSRPARASRTRVRPTPEVLRVVLSIVAVVFVVMAILAMVPFILLFFGIMLICKAKRASSGSGSRHHHHRGWGPPARGWSGAPWHEGSRPSMSGGAERGTA